MKQAGEDHAPCTVTAEYAIKLLRPTPTGWAGASGCQGGGIDERAGDGGRNLERRRQSLRDLPGDICRGQGRPSRISIAVGSQRLVAGQLSFRLRLCWLSTASSQARACATNRIRCPNSVDALDRAAAFSWVHEEFTVSNCSIGHRSCRGGPTGGKGGGARSRRCHRRFADRVSLPPLPALGRPGERWSCFPTFGDPTGPPYSETGPIFVHAEPCQRYANITEYPEPFRDGRVFRAYNSEPRHDRRRSGKRKRSRSGD